MPRGPSGIYNLPPSYRATSGQTIRTEQHNPPLEDIAQALTDSMPRSGVAPMTGNLPMGGRKVTNMAPATAAGDAVTFGQLSGVIVMWSGAAASIPAGWSLCDGTNGTPDLRGRFIVGAGGAYAVGSTGGAETVTLTQAQMPSHAHGAGTLATGTAGEHTHPATVIVGTPAGGGGLGTGNEQNVEPRVTIGAAGAHTHPITGNTGSAGSGEAHENRPPYYALCFIRKN